MNFHRQAFKDGSHDHDDRWPYVNFNDRMINLKDDWFDSYAMGYEYADAQVQMRKGIRT